MKKYLPHVNPKMVPAAIACLAVFILVGGSKSAFGQTTNTFPASGNVGIGTMSPALSLDVRANAVVYTSDARALIGNYDLTSMAQGVGGGIQFGGKYHSNGTLAGFASISGIKENALDNDFSSALVFTTRVNPGTQSEKMRISSAGNVGIGTTTPGEFVHIRKNQNAPTHLMVENTTAGALAYADLQLKNDLSHLAQFGLYSSTTTTAGALASGNAFAYTTSPAMVIMANNATGIIKFATGGLSERMRIDVSGNVGIGTTAPSAKLDVKDTNNFQVTPNQSAAGEFPTSVLINSVGAGLTLLPDGNGALGPKLFLGYRDTATPMWRSALEIANTPGFGNLLLMKSGGNVGIGTASPTSGYKLDVNGAINASGNINATGNITASGTISAKYQDVAEWVPASRALPAGTVVTLDPTKSNHVEASSRAYDTRVAGVISLQPGITLGENGVGKVLVATTGRVRVKVDATAGPIQVGDLLVTSDKEGIAKRSEPLNLGGVQIHRPGTLIGKALEPLEKGTGEILVLLSLQ